MQKLFSSFTMMVSVQCPFCRTVQRAERAVLGRAIGCQSPHCERLFRAERFERNRGPATQAVFALVIAFAIFLTVAWADRRWGIIRVATR